MKSRFIILCVKACLMAQLGAANVVLMGNNLTLSFDDTEASFGLQDDAECRRLQRNSNQWKRRAEMSDEQRPEINRKQREYRAWKKAESSHTTSVTTPTLAGLCNHDSVRSRCWLQSSTSSN
ncbi:hypothetical protein PVAP13_1KG261800 [Panicum virgatum]|uniref:Secreted protein n=1 Tax=Panicum virgatum TaxID=38727 RepID=A0A8T0XB33_PANVG|nr:hypothetical protein PVAP13_1KG261800 [Panicum virgatum]